LIEDLVMSVKNLSDWKTLYTFDFCSEKENLKLAQLIKDGAQAVFVTTRRITLYATVSQEILINYHGDLRGRDYFFSENNMTLVWSGHGPCGSDFLCSSQQHKKSTFCSCDLGKYFLFFLKLGKEGVNIEKKEVEIYTKTVAMLDGGEKIITASSKSILMWSVKNVEVIKEYPIESFASSCVVLTSDEKYMFFPSDSGFSFLRLDIESGEILTIYQETPEIKTYNLLLTPDEKYIISVGSGERVSVWDLESGRLVKRVHIPGLEEIYCLDRLDYEDS